MKFRPLSYLLLLAGSALLVSCATPIAPTGGPSDDQGPVVEKTIPESGTTNFTGRTFEFQFDEFVDRRSVAEAITVEPDLGINYEVSWSRKDLKIAFEDHFPDSTTVIIRLETDLSDTRGNNIEAPLTLAVSTGDEIDEGEITGKILLADNGKPAPDRRVLLYREPFRLDAKATYQAQTDTGGVFTFSYLAEGNYKAILVDDRNRNKIWEQQNESAYAFYEEIIQLPKAGADTLDVIYTTQVDSIAPSLQGVGLFSQNRMRLRFSEDIQFSDQTEFNITDSLGNAYSAAYPLYVSPAESFVLFAQSADPLIEEGNYQIDPTGVEDFAGNPVEDEFFSFTGTAQEDTTTQRIISTNGQNGLTQQEEFRVTYAAPITQRSIVDSLVVIEGDVDFNNWPEVFIVQNELVVAPQGEWIEGVQYQFLAWNPVTQRRKLYEIETWDAAEYGEIELTVEDADSTTSNIVQLIAPDGEEVRSEQFSKSITLTDLPPLSYTIVVFDDQNRNGEWDRGTITPYASPEKYYVQSNFNVQEGFTSQINIIFN